jgi:hypothetical protein
MAGYPLRVAASADGVVSGPVIIQAVTLVADAAAAASIKLFNASTQTGNPAWELSAPAGEAKSVAFPAGIRLDTALSVTLSGTGAVAYIALA